MGLPREFPGGKLIRHLLPEGSIAADGLTAVTHIEQGEQLVGRLQAKVSEEAHEVEGAKTPAKIAEELADVRQVIIDLCDVTDIKAADIRIGAMLETVHATDVAVWIDKLVERADALAAADPDDLVAPIGDVLEAVTVITAILGIRDTVREELARKLKENGRFREGVILDRTVKR